SKLILFAPAGSHLDTAATELGLETASEVFADRNYLKDGSLVPRSRSDAFVHDPVEAADRIIRMLSEGKVRAVDGSDVSVFATIEADPERAAWLKVSEQALSDTWGNSDDDTFNDLLKE